MASNNIHCTLCQEDMGSTHHYRVGEFYICRQCAKDQVVEKFEEALKYEFAYPPKLGAEVMEITIFADILPKAFLEDSRKREGMYAIPPEDRIFCPHKILRRTDDKMQDHILNVMDMENGAEHETETCGAYVYHTVPFAVICEECSGIVCGMCKGPVPDGEHGKHRQPWRCIGAAEASARGDPYEGLIRGKDYQVCPDAACKIKIELSEACNHMVCHRCSTSFCFICGAEADDGSDHWAQGRPCPRTNQPGAENALYDVPAVLQPVQPGTEERLLADLQVLEEYTQEARQLLDNTIRAGGQVPLWLQSYVNLTYFTHAALTTYFDTAGRLDVDVERLHQLAQDQLNMTVPLLEHLPLQFTAERPALALALERFEGVMIRWAVMLHNMLEEARNVVPENEQTFDDFLRTDLQVVQDYFVEAQQWQDNPIEGGAHPPPWVQLFADLTGGISAMLAYYLAIGPLEQLDVGVAHRIAQLWLEQANGLLPYIPENVFGYRPALATAVERFREVMDTWIEGLGNILDHNREG